MKETQETQALVVMNRYTAELAEMTQSWFGLIVWLMEYNDIKHDSCAGYPYLIFDDDKRFKHYDVIGEV